MGFLFFVLNDFSLWLTLLSTDFPVFILGDFNIFIDVQPTLGPIIS